MLRGTSCLSRIMSSRSDAVFLKTVVVGNGHVGKTNMIITHRTGEFPGSLRPVVANCEEHSLLVDGRNFTLLVRDTGGGEDYHRVRPIEYPGTHCFVLLFDVAANDDFEDVKSCWWKELRKHCPDVPIILVGSKIDLRESNEVKTISYEKGSKMAMAIGAKKYMEISSLKKIGLEELFRDVARIGNSYHNLPKPNKTEKKCSVL